MPILNGALTDEEWIDPDDVDRPIVIYGAMMTEMGELELEPHAHHKGQIILVQRGALSCEVDGGLWIVPPRSAIWIPGGAVHSVKGSGLEGYNAFFTPSAAADLPKACRAVSVTPLLRELLIRSASFPLLYEQTGPASRMVAVLMDEIAAAQVENLHLPMPIDERLRDVVAQMMTLPIERGTRLCCTNRVMAEVPPSPDGLIPQLP